MDEVGKLSPGADAVRESERQTRVLEAALATFLRFGYRKTSMDEVARAAQLSRQGLYLHFPAKEDLFRAALKHALDTGLAAANQCLRDTARPLEDQLVSAVDAWAGRYVGIDGESVTDLHEASATLGGPLLAEYEGAFVGAVARALRDRGLATAYKPSGVNSRQLAEVFNATVRGLKQPGVSREEFLAQVQQAVKVLCCPLRSTSSGS